MKGHRIRWFARIAPCPEAPDGWLPRTRQMQGQWNWDAKCSCGWESKTGGGVERYVRECIEDHKFDVEHGY